MRSGGIDETRAFARLPGLDVAVIHRAACGAEGEQVMVALKVVPSWGAFGQPLGVADPFLLWARLAQAAWASWWGWLAIGATPRPITRGE